MDTSLKLRNRNGRSSKNVAARSLRAVLIMTVVFAIASQVVPAQAPIDQSFAIDGKKVTIVSSTGGKPGYATIKFNTDVGWWTGVKMFEYTGKSWLIEKADGKYNPATRTIVLPVNLLPKKVKLEFWTAKALGAHTHMATRELVRERFAGRVVTINWGSKPAAPINETVKIDGESVTIRSSEAGNRGYVTIKFETFMPWWTALKFFDRFGREWVLSKSNGRYSSPTRSYKLPTNRLPGNVKLEFWTAKAFGVYTHMTSRSFATERLDGRTITVFWPHRPK